MASPPLFTLTPPPPSVVETPVVVEVPHAGLDVPAEYLAQLVAPARSIGRDADLYVDELYADAPACGATLLVAHTSRYVLDLNRSEEDWDDAGARAPRGIVWRLTTDGEPALARPLTPAELEARIDAVHRPYHRALREALDRKRARFGWVVLLAAHSMPSVARTGHVDASSARADVVPGTQGRTTAADVVIDAVDAHARDRRFTVRHDDPYRGGFTTRHYGRPREGIHAVQVELARRLYMDEATLERGAGFVPLRAWCRGLVEKLGRLALA